MLSSPHQDALNYILKQVKICAQFVFPSPHVNTLSTLQDPIHNRVSGFRDVSAVLLTKGAKLKLRHFHSPDFMHWGNPKWSSKNLFSSGKRHKDKKSQISFACTEIRRILVCPAVDDWVSSEADTDFMEVANILISRIANIHDDEVEFSESVEALSAAIEAQSSIVRDMKASKSTREAVTGEVNRLLHLKAQYREASGSDYRSSVRRSAGLTFYTTNGAFPITTL